MSDTTPNTPTVEELSASAARLRKALEAERAAHKATKEASRQFRARIASGLGLGDDANEDAISACLADTEAALAARTASIAKERDEARARLAEVESRWASEKVDTALRRAFEQSGARPEHLEDFLLLARPLFSVDETGAVRTRKDAKETIPGIDPAAWIHGELKAKRAHYWPTSIGGGSKGGGSVPVGGDDSCFDPTSPNYNFTKQLALEAKYGSEFADRARARYRGRGGAAW